jgi:hypothetical protein
LRRAQANMVMEYSWLEGGASGSGRDVRGGCGEARIVDTTD